MSSDDGVVVDLFKREEPLPEVEEINGQKIRWPTHFWQCNCGTVLFFVTPEGFQCSTCGGYVRRT